MNWRAGRATDVAATIVGEWEREPATGGPKVEEWRNLRYLKIDHASKEIEWIGEQHAEGVATKGPAVKQSFDIIILAIGFGQERRIVGGHIVSYWRNETYGQPDLSGLQKRYLISGNGDGGLIDLLRVTITDFREDRIGHELAPEGTTAFEKVRNLHADCYSAAAGGADHLFERSRKLGNELGFVDRIKRRLRADTVAFLQIKSGSRVSDAFRGKSSFANRFLVSLLFEAGGFSPRFGELQEASDTGFDDVIIRHGTKKTEHLQAVFSSDVSGLIHDLDDRRAGKPVVELSQRRGLWETGWPFDRKTTPGPGSAKRDYVPEATIAVSSAFVSALAPIFSARGGRYRATLHRIVAMGVHPESEVHLQQVAHYHGPRGADAAGLPVTGRLFKVDDAVIGLAAKTRRVLITPPLDRKDDEYREQLRDDMKRLGGDKWDPKRMDLEVSSLFACPLVFCAAEADPIAAGKVVAVLFADSTQVGAFDDQTARQIVAACEEFGRYLERIAQGKATELVSVQSQATSYSPESAASVGDLKILKKSDIVPPRVSLEHLNLEWWN